MSTGLCGHVKGWSGVFFIVCDRLRQDPPTLGDYLPAQLDRTMKNFLGIIVALVVGIVLGAFQPRGEVLELRQKLDEANAAAARRSKGVGLDQIRSMFQPGGGETEEAAPKRHGTTHKVDEPSPSAEPTGPSRDPDAPMRPEDMKKQLAEMQAAMDARRAHALEALVEQAALTDEQVGKVDDIFDQMNDSLKKEVDAFVARATTDGDVSRRDFMELGADALDTVLATDDAIRGAIGEEAYNGLGDELTDPLSYVDGTTVESLGQIANLPGFGEQ